MAKYIYKYTLQEASLNELRLPKHGIIRKVAEQHGNLCLWLEFSTVILSSDNSETELRTFRIFATGQQIQDPELLHYIDTVIMAGGSLVWHLYEVIKDA